MPDTTGNFVVLNLQKGQQLPFPAIRYLPADNGHATMAVDFPGACVTGGSQSFRFAGSAVKQLTIGQLQSYPPVMRVTLVAQNTQDFQSIDFRSGSGSLIIRLPSQGVNIRQGYEQPPVVALKQGSTSSQGSASISATAPRTAPPLATTSRDAMPPAAPSSDQTYSSRALLRPPMAMAAAVDATYTFLPEKSATQSEPKTQRLTTGSVERKPVPAAAKKIQPDAKPEAKSEAKPEAKPDAQPEAKTDQSASSQPEGHGLKHALKHLFGLDTPSKDDEGSEESPSSPKSARATAQASNVRNGTIAVSLDTAGAPVLRVDCSKPVNIKTFKLSTPDRYVIDIEGVSDLNATLPEVPSDCRYMKGMRIGAPEGATNTTRLVVDLPSDHLPISEKVDQLRNSISLIFGANEKEEEITQAPRRVSHNCTVVLDAGHGGSDPGAQRGDIQEKEITLSIVNKLKKDLESRGVHVRMTRSDDTFVSLEDRVRITNDIQPDCFVSVHINSLETNNGTTGIETYYQTEGSKDLAQLIHQALVKQLEAPDRGVRKARFYVINHTPVPAILAEVGFISTKEERDKLISSDYQTQVAGALTDGVMLYLAQRAPLALHPAAAPHSNESVGTISSVPASSTTQSFTQNLHSKPAPERAHRQPEAVTGKAIRAKLTAEKRKTISVRQSLKFKKSHLASTRS